MHILTNGPHLVTPQQALEVSQTHILGAISCYFRTVIVKDPVYDIFWGTPCTHIFSFVGKEFYVFWEDQRMCT